MSKNTTIELLKMSDATTEKIKTIKNDIEQLKTINGEIVRNMYTKKGGDYNADAVRATLNENRAKIEKLNNKVLALSIKNQAKKKNIK